MDIFSNHVPFVFFMILVVSGKVCCTEGSRKANLTENALSFWNENNKGYNNNYKAVGELRKGTQTNQNPLAGLIPMLATPFLVQTTFLPMMLLGIKLMLIKSIFLGKLAVIFWLVNLLRNNIKDQQGHLYSHNIHLGHHS